MKGPIPYTLHQCELFYEVIAGVMLSSVFVCVVQHKPLVTVVASIMLLNQCKFYDIISGTGPFNQLYNIIQNNCTILVSRIAGIRFFMVI